MIPIEKITGRLGNKMFQFAYLYAQFRKGNIPDYYLQSYEYFDEYRDEIRQLFGEGIGHLPYVAIHIRRGKNPANPDEPAYSENPFYVDLTRTDYYEKAMAMFPDKKFLVFSDDINWCIENFMPIKADYIFSQDKTELEDFNQMASCEHHIIANSSFSYWAAYLCPHLNKKVIAPSKGKWYSDGVERTKCPPEWTRI